MIHPIFMTVLRRPDLLFTHLTHYAELARGELTALGVSLAVRAASAAVALVALLLALGLTGVAVMLGFLNDTFHWVLVAVPGVAWLLVLLGVIVALRGTLKDKVDDVKDEIQADFVLLRAVKEANDD